MSEGTGYVKESALLLVCLVGQICTKNSRGCCIIRLVHGADSRFPLLQ